MGSATYLFVQLVSLHYIGNMNDPVILAGVGMGNVLINVFGLALMMGLSSALETFVVQCYVLRDFKMCGVYLNRARLVVTLLMLPIAAIFSLSHWLLDLVNQDVEVAYIAQEYCLMMLPGIWAMGCFDASRKFLAAQFRNPVTVYIQLITCFLHFCWC